MGATGRASLQFAERSVISNNRIAAFGALGVGGDGELSIQLSSANVTDNVLADTGLVAVGGTGTSNISGDGATDVAFSGNTRESKSAVFTEQPLVTDVLDVLLGSGERVRPRCGLLSRCIVCCRWARRICDHIVHSLAWPLPSLLHSPPLPSLHPCSLQRRRHL